MNIHQTDESYTEILSCPAYPCRALARCYHVTGNLLQQMTSPIQRDTTANGLSVSPQIAMQVFGTDSMER
jgi:hypothetical protein